MSFASMVTGVGIVWSFGGFLNLLQENIEILDQEMDVSFFYVLLTVRLGIIIVNKQLDAQFLFL